MPQTEDDMSTTTQLMTADELLQRPDDGFRYELVKGELRKLAPAGGKHGRLVVELTIPIAVHVRDHNLGEVFGAETGFRLADDPDTVRAPDIAFVRRETVEQVGDPDGYWPGPPDLAVEVVSKNDRNYEVEEKVQEWLHYGTSQVWVVSPKLRVVTIYNADGTAVVLTGRDTIDGGEVLPGFHYSVAELFS